ncbi:helix-turn-helix domain-containing protein [Jannaschia sp. W003]|uniref:helix-turn-helix domain-containing protein n=1 Tax=Jannaschia sp. W003 TaxID=2867012 RepID=UPI0021A36AED|nr:XRE family transcriptional regulator [Jannaschia sp. W003]UWQ20581.1 XRE family transcriptional regulator [Jannaschia sp. W003]
MPTGDDLRALRRTRGLTLAEAAGRVGRSIGWLSQVERGRSTPDPDDLASLARAMDAPLSLLAPRGPEAERGRIVRTAHRRPLGERVLGLTEYLLSPDLTDGFEVIHSTFAPGAWRDDPVTRATTEIAHLVSGRLDLTIGGAPFSLAPGDTARIRGEPFTWANPYREPAVAIWTITPALYSQDSQC